MACGKVALRRIAAAERKAAVEALPSHSSRGARASVQEPTVVLVNFTRKLLAKVRSAVRASTALTFEHQGRGHAQEESTSDGDGETWSKLFG